LKIIEGYSQSYFLPDFDFGALKKRREFVVDER